MFDVEYVFFQQIVHLTSFKTTDILITLGNTSTKDLSAQSLTIIISKIGFQTMSFYINFGCTKLYINLCRQKSRLKVKIYADEKKVLGKYKQ